MQDILVKYLLWNTKHNDKDIEKFECDKFTGRLFWMKLDTFVLRTTFICLQSLGTIQVSLVSAKI